MRHNDVCGIQIALDKADGLSLFPQQYEIYERGKMIAMRVLQKILYTFVMVGCLSLAVLAQKKDDQKKPPPKPPPPVINPGEGKKPPKNDDKPKKPAYVIVALKGRADGESA